MYLSIHIILFHVSRHLHVVLHRDNGDNVRACVYFIHIK